MSICFVANKDLTVVFSDIARELRKRGEHVFWLSPSTRWSRWLVAEGWPSSDILNFPDFASEWTSSPLDASAGSLADVEGEPPATIGNIILMCRNLRRRPKTFAYGYLASARKHIEHFLRAAKVELVFGEGTWGFEHMTWLVCRHLGIPMVAPLTTRIPSDRFYFSDPISGDLFAFCQSTATDRTWAMDFLAAWTARPVQPAYARASKGYTPFHRRWLGELSIGLFRPRLDRHDETLWPLRLRIFDRLKRAANDLLYRWLKFYETPPKDERYVLYCLHHQPESAIDVYGALNSNQASLIETVSRTLPVTHKLWVKEHIGALGDRSPAWYRRIARLPNIRLVDPYLDIYDLIRRSSLVVTISGTVGYEAALMGVPVVGLSSVFFASLLSNRVDSASHPLEWSFADLLSPSPVSDGEDRHKRVEFLARLHANSFFGNPAPLGLTDTERAHPLHLQNEREAFAAFIDGVRQLPPKARGGGAGTTGG